MRLGCQPPGDVPGEAELAQAGVRSRRLVHAGAAEAAASAELPIRAWLTETDIGATGGSSWTPARASSVTCLSSAGAGCPDHEPRACRRSGRSAACDRGMPRRTRRRGWPPSLAYPLRARRRACRI
jgi:hypothetical protein